MTALLLSVLLGITPADHSSSLRPPGTGGIKPPMPNPRADVQPRPHPWQRNTSPN